ncbi:MAG: FAD-dependent oxidoreductase [Spirosomataceae bacterium]
MDLRSESPYWLMKNGFLYSYPSLDRSLSVEVVIMGGGITGALLAYHLSEAGISCIVLDKRKIGMGSTCASTALLQYEIDTPLTELIEYVGYEKAVRSYLLCIEAIDKIEKITRKLKADTGFERRPSLYYASRKKDTDDLRREYFLRRDIGIRLDFLTKQDIEAIFPFSASSALYSADGAQIDAYRFTHELFQSALRNETLVFDDTTVVGLRHLKNKVILTTEQGHTVKAGKLILACGYESQGYLSKKVVNFNSSFAVVSEPFRDADLWYQNCLIWETARPYLYLRTTSDQRVLIGGKDEPFYNPRKRDALTYKKAAQLTQAFQRRFPHLTFRPDFQWAGTFAETKDGLPYIGTVPERPNTYFVMGFGGNGIVFSMIAAEIIRDLLVHKKSPDAGLFGFERIDRR